MKTPIEKLLHAAMYDAEGHIPAATIRAAKAEAEALYAARSPAELANAFLRWPLPESVCADLCATQRGPGRIGTNLLTYDEAVQMFRYLSSHTPDSHADRVNKANDRLTVELESLCRDKARLEWHTGTPEVKEGGSEVFWCAVRAWNGKIVHRYLVFLNAYVMPLMDSCYDAPKTAVPVGDDGDYAWTGWHEESCDQCETQWGFNDEVIAWMRLPRFDAAMKEGTQ